MPTTHAPVLAGTTRPLDGTVALITGAGRGIGRAIAIAYAASGAAVVLGARSTDELAATAAEITTAGGHTAWQACDVTDPDSLAALAQLASDRFGGLDIVVANAGVSPPLKPFNDYTPEDWNDGLAVNLLGVVNTLRAALPHLRARGGGKILVVGSGAGRSPAPHLSIYAASKAAVAMLVKTLAVEMRAHGIAVNELVPGPVATRLSGLDGHTTAPEVLSHEWVKRPEDVTPLALYLGTLPNHGPTGQTFSLAARPT